MYMNSAMGEHKGYRIFLVYHSSLPRAAVDAYGHGEHRSFGLDVPQHDICRMGDALMESAKYEIDRIAVT